jgi:hypothetical protein
MIHPSLALLVGLTATGTTALAQSNIDPVNKYSWQENCGWINWRDANATNQGVVVGSTFLSGFVWGENIGWINLGDGTGPYANNTGLDFGVNRDPIDGMLTGFAWGENVGWINFKAAHSPRPPTPPGSSAGRFRGYAWGENIGWINLDDPSKFVGFAVACYPDCDASGILNIDDFICFQTFYAIGDPYADCDASGNLNIDDFICFQTFYAIGC